MRTLAQNATTVDTVTRRRSPLALVRDVWHSDARRRFWRRPANVAALVWVLFVAVVVVVGPLWAQDPNLASPVDRLQPPSSDHWFGTDQLGRDVFSRVLAGGRTSLIVTIVATFLALVLGAVLGLISGYRGRRTDDFLSRFFDIVASVPTLLLGIVIVVVLGGSLTTVIVAISIGTIPLYGRLFRAGALTLKNREYVEGAKTLGFSGSRIVVRHILPNAVIPILVIATGNMGRLALSEASLSYLGAGIQPPDASWGNMIAQGQEYLQYAPWVPVIPGTVLTLVSLAFSFIGDGLRDAFDIRESASLEMSG